MTSPTYAASADNSTSCATLSDERLVLLCYEMLRTYHHFSSSANLPPWHLVDKDRKIEVRDMIRDGLDKALSGETLDAATERQVLNPYIVEWRIMTWLCRCVVNSLRAQGVIPPLPRGG